MISIEKSERLLRVAEDLYPDNFRKQIEFLRFNKVGLMEIVKTLKVAKQLNTKSASEMVRNTGVYEREYKSSDELADEFIKALESFSPND